MKVYKQSNNYTLYDGNMLDMLDVIDNNSVDAVITDPPYELNFMGKGWDSTGIAFQKETWKKCYAVLKPGGYLLSFGGTRTFHRIACAIEDAGFEIRDTIMWLYATGFPRGINLANAIEAKLTTGSANTQEFKNLTGEKCVSGDWGFDRMQYEQGSRPSDYSQDSHERTVNAVYSTEEANKVKGWNSSLKPSYEPIIVARKPFDGSLVDNVLKNGVGGLNIDECRVSFSSNEPDGRVGTDAVMHTSGDKMWYGENGYAGKDVQVYNVQGRFPANVILTYNENDYDEVCGGFPVGGKNGSITKQYDVNNRVYGEYGHCNTWEAYNDSGSASRYFYCAKASKKDRDDGLEDFEYYELCDGVDSSILKQIEKTL